MTGETSFFGVFVPTFLLLALAAALISIVTAQVMARLSLYRWFHNRPLVDLAIFVLILALLCWAASAKVIP
jgi:hypothetical protein